MCGPAIPLIGLAISTASAVASHSAKKDQAKAVERANQTNAANAAMAAQHEYNALESRRRDVEENASVEGFDIGLDMLRAAATTKASAAHAGVAGLSVDALLRDIYGEGGRSTARIADGIQRQNDQIERERQGVHSRQVARSQGQPVNAPSGLGLAIDIASAGLDYASATRKT